MRMTALTLGLILSATAATVARAGDTACWFENGAVVAPAEIGGIAGDWLIDPSAPHTLLHDTRADMEGLPGTFSAGGHLAGMVIKPVVVTVDDLDGRAPGFPTPITGVIGADVLARYTVDLQFSPCRVRLWPGRAPRFGRATALPLEMVGGAPAIRAAVSDDYRARAGLFAVDWSSRAAVRVVGADLRPPAEGLSPTPRMLAPARLRALSVAGDLYEDPSAAVADDLDPALASALGVEFWSRWRLRLDIARGELLLRPQ